MLTLHPLDRAGLRWAQQTVTAQHYLRAPLDARCSVEGYGIDVDGLNRVGLLLFGRPEATRCGDWYGGVKDAQDGKVEVTRWQVLNLARVWLDPRVQRGGEWYSAARLPGFVDRRGEWRSTLATTVIRQAAQQVGFDYLLRRPPCFLDEPYEIRWLLSYCDTRLHRGIIYQQSGFELYRTNARGIQTWRIRLPALSAEQDAAVRSASYLSARSQRYRAQRQQLRLLEVSHA